MSAKIIFCSQRELWVLQDHFHIMQVVTNLDSLFFIKSRQQKITIQGLKKRHCRERKRQQRVRGTRSERSVDPRLRFIYNNKMLFSHKNFSLTADVGEVDRYSAHEGIRSSQKAHSENRDGSMRIRKISSEMKKVKEQYNLSLREFLNARKNSNEAKSKVSKIRSSFIKNLENKKGVIRHKSLMEERKTQMEEKKYCSSQKVRNLKAMNDFVQFQIRLSKQKEIEKLQEKMKEQKEKMRKNFKITKQKQTETAKNQYLVVKNEENRHRFQKKNIKMILSTKSRHNYLMKVGKQLQKMKDYEDLLSKVNHVSKGRQYFQGKQREGEDFFMTKIEDFSQQEDDSRFQ